jgi:hypothetical protein
MAKPLQPGAINDAADYSLADIALRRGRMNMYQGEELSWTLQRLHDRVSFSGWFFAMISGLCMWALMFRLFI